jgi:cytochrome c-type biogenesis protein CcmH/NrfG
VGYVVAFAVAVFLGGLLLLALLAVGVYRRVRSLGRTVGTAATRVADASAELETIAPRDR